ncbi:MAG: YIP1 family protein [Actinomycetota bacterium]
MSTVRPSTADRSYSSAHLGATLRTVLTSPTAGFEAAGKAVQRRLRAGISPAEGYAPWILAACGGASAFVMWLKISALVGLREVHPADLRWSFVVAAAVLGALIAILAQAVFAFVAARLAGEDGPSAAGFRTVWGASAFPAVVPLLLLLPVDILVVGAETFASGKPSDPVSSAWAALSLALGVAALLWSAALFVKGLRVVAGWRPGSVLLATLGALSCLAVVVLAFRSGAIALMETLS